jgi:SagB-type dehydrogenase family enzyme
MNENFFIREGIGGSAGMIVHEATKNFEKGRKFWKSADGVSPAVSWIREVYPDAFRADPIAYAEPAARVEAPTGFLDSLYRRRSMRAYANVPLTIEALGRFLALSYPPEVVESGYTAELQPHQSLTAWNGHVTACRLVLIATRIEGLAPGPYLVDEYVRGLRSIKQVPPQEVTDLLESACFQEEFRRAPAFFVQIGSIHDALQRYGDRGYRYMLIENGVQMQRMYLSASSLGFAGCVTGSIVQKEFEQWLGLDGYSAAVLNCFALGFMPEQFAASDPQS